MKNQFADFNKFIEGQFRYGGEKYKATGTKEATDMLFDNHGFAWLIGTVDKYTYRFTNLERERDLLKISAYCYIIWLKRGFHLLKDGTPDPINTTVEVKSKHFADFILTVYSYYENNRHYLETVLNEDAVKKISNTLVSFSKGDWASVSEEKLAHIYCLSFVVWHYKYYQTGKAGTDTDTNNEEKRFTEVLTNAAREVLNGIAAPGCDEAEIEVLVKAQVKALLKKKD